MSGPNSNVTTFPPLTKKDFPWPKFLGAINIPVDATPIGFGTTKTYDLELGAEYREVLVNNFQWVTIENTASGEPGALFGHGAFNPDDEGPFLIANKTPGGWRRIFKMQLGEYANNINTNLNAETFDGSSDVPVPLGYGSASKNVALDHINAFGKKIQIEDVYVIGTKLRVIIKNVETSGSISLDVYAGVERVYGYRGDTYYSTVADDGFIAVSADRHSESLWISTDFGLTWTEHTDTSHTSMLAGASAYLDSDYFMAFLDYDLNVWTGDSSTGYTWAQSNTWSLPWGGDDYHLQFGGDINRASLGGNCIDWNPSIGAFFAFHGYTVDATLFFSANGFIDAGANNPTYDDVLPVFKGSVQLADMSPYNPGGWTGNMDQAPFVKTVSTDDLFVSFCYWGGGLSQVVEITCSADISNSLQNAYFFIGSEQNANKTRQPWFNVSGGGTDPGHPNPIEIAIVTDDADTAVATALAAAFTATGEFSCVTVGNVVTVTTLPAGQTSGIGSDFTGGQITFNQTQASQSFRRQALFHSPDKGATWSEVLAASNDWKRASNRFVSISDDGSEILVIVMGKTGQASYPYDDGELRFNYSTNGGASFVYADSSWPLVTTTGSTRYSEDPSTNAPFISEGKIARTSNGTIICIFRRNSDLLPSITRSTDNGTTWDTPAALAAWTSFPDPYYNRGRQSDTIDEFFSYISYGYVQNDSQSFTYIGRAINLLTHWQLYGAT